METLIESYWPTILTLGALGGLLLLQLLVADVAGILQRHTPGTQVAADHGNFLFRAVRAHANTNESVSIFVLLVAFALFVSGSPAAVNGSAVGYLIGRIGHMCCYYANVKLLRSVFFAVSLFGLFGLLAAGLRGL